MSINQLFCQIDFVSFFKKIKKTGRLEVLNLRLFQAIISLVLKELLLNVSTANYLEIS